MALLVLDLEIEQGATFELHLKYVNKEGEPMPMASHVARMQVRLTHKAQDALMSLTSTDGDIVIGASDGTVVITGSAEATSALPAKRCVYDVELEDTTTGHVVRLAEGMIVVSPEVTR